MLIRFDIKPTKNDNVFWKGQWFTSDNIGLGTSGWPSGDQNRWGILSHYLYKDDGWSANWVHIFNQYIVNEFNFGMRHDSEGFIPDDSILPLVDRSTQNYTAPQLFPENNTLETIPRVTSWSGVPGSNPAQINWLTRWGAIGNDYVQPAFSDNLSYILGKHSLKFGMYFERLLNGEAAGSNWSGTLSFTNSTSSWSAAQGNTGHPYATAILGYFQSYSEDQFRPHTNIEQDMLQWYGQDQWKFSRRLTLNFGMRFGWHTPFYQRDDVGSSFDPSLYDPANRPRFYVPVCTVPLPSNGTACPTANRRVIDPANPSVLLTNLNLNRTYVPGSGNLLNGLQLAKDPNTPKGYREFSRVVDLEPRVGLAYDLTGKGRTVLRGMVGVYHTPRAGGGTTGDLTQNPPEQRGWTVTNGHINDLETLFAQVRATAPIFPWGAVRGLEIQTHTPEIYNFSVGIQQDIGWGTVVEASYVGSRGRWLGEQRDINQIPDESRFVNCEIAGRLNVPCHPENRDPFVNLNSGSITTGALNDDFLRPFLGYGDAINYVTFSGSSRYDSLQVQVNRRYAQGFQYGVAYTWSKSTDVTSDDRDGLVFATGPALGGRDYRKFNFAPSDFDQRHVFAVNYIWDIPFFNKGGNGFVRALLGGWILSGTTTFATGKPKDISVSYSSGTVTISAGQTCPAGSFFPTGSTTSCVAITDFTGGSTNALPFSTCDDSTGTSSVDSEGTPVFANASCFSRPTKFGDLGDRARNVLRRPSIFNTDIALFKNFKWGEKRTIQLRWETYNIFNHSNFSDIDSGLTYALFQVNPGGTGAACNTTTNICTAEYRQTNSSFGAATAARSPRVMQVSIRINF